LRSSRLRGKSNGLLNNEESMTIENDLELKHILKTIKTVASVGVSSNPEKESYGIYQYLLAHGYRMIPVNPTALEILGEKAYPDLAALPVKVEVVQVFRRPEDVPPVVEAAIQIGAQIVWMQEGVVNEQAAARAEAAGLKVVMDRCMRKTHQRLIGE
jgi:predicted CoA-binding protein